MNKNTMVYTNIEARMKGFNIEITATNPDQEDATVLVENEDIKTLYKMNSAKFFQEHGEDESVLMELFTAINGISISE